VSPRLPARDQAEQGVNIRKRLRKLEERSYVFNSPIFIYSERRVRSESMRLSNYNFERAQSWCRDDGVGIPSIGRMIKSAALSSRVLSYSMEFAWGHTAWLSAALR
jgi:hypothetical protein